MTTTRSRVDQWTIAGQPATTAVQIDDDVAAAAWHLPPTAELVDHLIRELRSFEDAVLSPRGEVDYAAADMLEAIAQLHDAGTLDLERLDQVRAFALAVLGPRGVIA